MMPHILHSVFPLASGVPGARISGVPGARISGASGASISLVPGAIKLGVFTSEFPGHIMFNSIYYSF